MSASIEPASVYLGEAATYKITVTGAQSPPAAQVPQIDGLDVSFSGTSQSTNQSITIINGRMTQEVQATFYMSYQLSPKRGGSFQIPAIAVSAGGQTLSTQPLTLTVIAPGTDERAWLEVEAAPNPVSIGEEFKVTFKLYLQKLTYQNQVLDINPFVPRDPPALDIPWFESLSNTETKDFKSFASGYIGSPGFTINNYASPDFFSRRLVTFKLLQSNVTVKGKPCYLYRIEKTFKAVKTGQVELAPCAIKGSLLDQVVGLNEATKRSVYQTSNPLTVRIVEPSDKGRPAEWSGAIGHFDISASADPVKLNLGDPVTLTVTIKGDGLWQTVDAPDLGGQEEFARGFKIHDKDVPGEQTAEGKVFRFTIRPTQSDVRAIPPIRYAYFDPNKKTYALIQSRAIPIDIRSSEKVRLDEVVEAQGQAAPPEMREVVEGLFANESDPDLALSIQGIQSGVPHRLAVLSMPVLFILLGTVVVIRSKRDPERIRSRRALRVFQKTLDDLAGGPGMTDQKFASSFLAAASAYVSGRLGLPEVSLTAAEMDRRLAASGISEQMRQDFRRLLDDLERLQYSSLAVAIDRNKTCAGMIDLARRMDSQMGRLIS